MTDPDFLAKLHRYQTARLRGAPEGTGYVRITWACTADPDAPAVGWIGLDGPTKGHHGVSPASELDEWCL